MSYSPDLFKKVRHLYKIAEFEIIESLRSENNREQIFRSNQITSEGLSSNDGGRSNSFFFFTDDSKFIVKTIPNSERNVLL